MPWTDFVKVEETTLAESRKSTTLMLFKFIPQASTLLFPLNQAKLWVASDNPYSATGLQESGRLRGIELLILPLSFIVHLFMSHSRTE